MKCKKKSSSNFSSGGNPALKFSQRLQSVPDSACVQYTNLLVEYSFKATGLAVKNLWRIA